MKGLVIILIVVVLVVLFYNLYNKNKKSKTLTEQKIDSMIESNVTNYAGLNIPSTATPPISNNSNNNYVYIQSKYTTGIKVFTNPTLTSYINLKAGDYVGELKETKIIGGYEFYVTTSGRYVHKAFSELKGLR